VSLSGRDRCITRVVVAPAHDLGSAVRIVTVASHQAERPLSQIECDFAFLGAKKQLQACLAQPGDEMFRCTSPGCSPNQ